MTRDHRIDPEVHALLGAYALDAMDEAQRRAFEAHLEDCESCRVEVAELQATAALLGQATEAVPPAGMQQRVLDAIDTIRQDAPVVSHEPRPHRSAATRRPILAGAAAVLAFAVIALGVLYAQTTARLNQLEGVVATAAAGDKLVAVLSAPDARVSDVAVTAGGLARFAWSDQRNLGVLVGDRLPPAPNGEIYALWLINGEDAEYAGSFVPNDAGRVAAVVRGGLSEAEMLGVTAEPAGRPVQPTGELVISTPLG